VTLGLLMSPAAAQSQLAVTVVDAMGAPLTGLTAESFQVSVDKSPRQVQKAEYRKDLLNVALLVETSAYAGMGRAEQIARMAAFLIQQLGEKEQMAVISYATNADLLQEFTSSKPLLLRSLAGVKNGNDASTLDAIYATLDSAFHGTVGRNVVMVISTGAEGYNKVKRPEIVGLAEQRKVSIFGIALNGNKDPLQRLAEETAGAFYGGRELRQPDALAKNILDSFRGYYLLTLSGALEGKVSVDVVPVKEKLQITQRREAARD
jgi:VWFA-related protein